MLSLLDPGLGIPHSNAVINFAASATNYSATSHAAFALTLSSGTQAVTLGSNIACVRFALIQVTDQGTQRVHVNVGNGASKPAAATLSSPFAAPGKDLWVRIPDGGTKINAQGWLSCIATAGTTNGTLTWYA